MEKNMSNHLTRSIFISRNVLDGPIQWWDHDHRSTTISNINIDQLNNIYAYASMFYGMNPCHKRRKRRKSTLREVCFGTVTDQSRKDGNNNPKISFRHVK